MDMDVRTLVLAGASAGTLLLLCTLIYAFAQIICQATLQIRKPTGRLELGTAVGRRATKKLDPTKTRHTFDLSDHAPRNNTTATTTTNMSAASPKSSQSSSSSSSDESSAPPSPSPAVKKQGTSAKDIMAKLDLLAEKLDTVEGTMSKARKEVKAQIDAKFKELSAAFEGGEQEEEARRRQRRREAGQEVEVVEQQLQGRAEVEGHEGRRAEAEGGGHPTPHLDGRGGRQDYHRSRGRSGVR
jgi:hypothetical protein